MNTNLDRKQVEYHANPTQADIVFGYGTTKYKCFPFDQVMREDGSLKRWVADEKGRRWYR